MTTEVFKPFSHLPFMAITDFKVGVQLIFCLNENDPSADLAYIYNEDGDLQQSPVAVPDSESQAMPALIGNDVYASHQGSLAPFTIYKNGLGWWGNGFTIGRLASVGKKLFFAEADNDRIIQFDTEVGPGSAQVVKLFATGYAPHRHSATTTHHVVTLLNAALEDENGDPTPDRYTTILYDSGWNQLAVLGVFAIDSGLGVTDLAMNSDRVAMGVNGSAVSFLTNIQIFDLTGTLKNTVIHDNNKADVVLMTEKRLYASNRDTGVITMWDITDDGMGNKTYTPAGTFTTPAPYAFMGNIST